ncbi:MAG TPA: DUF4416 family protein [Smithellaceae bacterium]|nr:DUF4416 family protein [Smithellaceae bacterium]
MSKPTPAEPVKLIFSVFSDDSAKIDETISALAFYYGLPDFISAVMPFDYTDYYCPEMGAGLVRRFISMEKLIRPESLPDIKEVTNGIEDKSAHAGKRSVNIDPGYLSKAHLILATGKGYSHRPYLRDGIYADLTLIYQNKKFCVLPWTYPDYASTAVQGMLEKIRTGYLQQLKADVQ